MATGSDLIEMPSGREGTQANNNGITTRSMTGSLKSDVYENLSQEGPPSGKLLRLWASERDQVVEEIPQAQVLETRMGPVAAMGVNRNVSLTGERSGTV